MLSVFLCVRAVDCVRTDVLLEMGDGIGVTLFDHQCQLNISSSYQPPTFGTLDTAEVDDFANQQQHAGRNYDRDYHVPKHSLAHAVE